LPYADILSAAALFRPEELFKKQLKRRAGNGVFPYREKPPFWDLSLF
jgi:hypothetical protein